ncbi:MAG: ISAs1 family transposase [Pseudorhodobacter sp.]|nr:ISAs1 family transposase [Pseudorhodobacter sp.]
MGIALLELVPRMDIFLAAFDDIPDPRADNARHDLCELLVVGFVAVLRGATSCAEMADFGRAKEHVFRDFLKLRHSIPSHDTFSTVFRMIDPKALDAAFGRVLAQIAALLGDGDVIAIDGKALRGARDKGRKRADPDDGLGLCRPPAPDAGDCCRRQRQKRGR